jgi:light-regulated signal transduction histidine kinase (bacteriophytochrome)
MKEARSYIEDQKPPLNDPNTEFDRFVYIVSHDLQEPLRMMTSFVKLLDAKCSDKLDEESTNYLKMSLEHGEKMRRMIYALVDYSRVERTAEEVTQVDLDQMMQDLLPMFAMEIDKNQAILEIDDLPTVKGRFTQLMTLFRNLLDNVFENVREIPLHLKLTVEDEGDQYRFCLEDNGKGIKDVYLVGVFEMFRKVDPNTINIGAGLAMAKAIARKHGGEIWADSQPGVGTRVYLTLPK